MRLVASPVVPRSLQSHRPEDRTAERVLPGEGRRQRSDVVGDFNAWKASSAPGRLVDALHVVQIRFDLSSGS